MNIILFKYLIFINIIAFFIIIIIFNFLKIFLTLDLFIIRFKYISSTQSIYFLILIKLTLLFFLEFISFIISRTRNFSNTIII